MADRPDYRLTIRPVQDDVPPAVRLRGVLKRLLRSYGFRALQVEEIKPAAGASGRAVTGAADESRHRAAGVRGGSAP
jgi:hypothetical protein